VAIENAGAVVILCCNERVRYLGVREGRRELDEGYVEVSGLALGSCLDFACVDGCFAYWTESLHRGCILHFGLGGFGLEVK